MSMTTNKQALREAAEKANELNPAIGLKEFASRTVDYHALANPAIVMALLDELEALDRRIAELESEKETLRPVGVMSEKAFHRLEGSESRFIALWPRPGIYLPRKRPEDGVIVYARTAGISVKGE